MRYSKVISLPLIAALLFSCFAHTGTHSTYPAYDDSQHALTGDEDTDTIISVGITLALLGGLVAYLLYSEAKKKREAEEQRLAREREAEERRKREERAAEIRHLERERRAQQREREAQAREREAERRRLAEERKREEMCEPTISASPQLQRLWTYEELDDEMSTNPIRTATIRSSNTVNLAFPYRGAQRGTLALRSHPRFGESVIFLLERGQILCSSFSCDVLVRFDEGESVNWDANSETSGRSTALFLRDHDTFVDSLWGSEVVRIAPTIYGHGQTVFEFRVAGYNHSKYLCD